MTAAHHKTKHIVLVIMLAFVLVPIIGGATTTESVVGSTCLVPIIHTDFAFPPEGGKIVKIGDQMYFVQSYRAECANAGANGILIKGSQSGTVAGINTSSPTVTNNNTQEVPTCLSRVY